MKSMKTMIRLMTCAVVATMSMEAARASLNIPSDGSDGALVIAEDTVIDLSQAVTSNWDANNGANVGKGIYDSNKWAVVFKYSSVTIQAGATVTFKNHASRAPVVWLVQGDVAINGTVSLDGQSSQPPPWLAEPGPGGFRGGAGDYAAGAANAAGFGPGGGGLYGVEMGGGAAYGSAVAGNHGWYGAATYGNPSLIPLVGGSGGGGVTSNRNYGWVSTSGGAGAGAMLIAAAGNLSILGAIRANGGGITINSDMAGGGSGGGIRLVAENLSGSGILQATGGSGSQNPGGLGRIRLERTTNSFAGTLVPTGPSVVELAPGATPVIWLPSNGPTVRIVSIEGKSASADPRAGFGAIGADIVLPQVANVTVVVETTVAEDASTVTVRATPRSNGNYSERVASLTEVVSEDPKVIRWTANVPVSDGYAAIQVKVVRP